MLGLREVLVRRTQNETAVTHDVVTRTFPVATLISVPVHVSLVSHRVPRTVAAAYLPEVEKFPCASPQRLRFRAGEREASPAVEAHGAPPVSIRSVSPVRDCVTVNSPP